MTFDSPTTRAISKGANRHGQVDMKVLIYSDMSSDPWGGSEILWAKLIPVLQDRGVGGVLRVFGDPLLQIRSSLVAFAHLGADQVIESQVGQTLLTPGRQGPAPLSFDPLPRDYLWLPERFV